MVKKSPAEEIVPTPATQMAISADPQMMAYLRALDPNLGVEEIAGAGINPNLNVVRNNERALLEDGSKAEVGQLYHVGLKKAWNTLDVHFVYARPAYLFVEWDEEKKDWNRQGEQKNHLLVGGCLADEQMTPFIYKIKGMNW